MTTERVQRSAAICRSVELEYTLALDRWRNATGRYKQACVAAESYETLINQRMLEETARVEQQHYSKLVVAADRLTQAMHELHAARAAAPPEE